MTAEQLDELLRTVRFRVGPYSPNVQELPAGARAAIVALLLPAIEAELARG